MLYSTMSIGAEATWIGADPLADGEPLRCTCKFRYRQGDQPVEVRRDGQKLLIHALTPQRAVTPGQSAVFYQGKVPPAGRLWSRFSTRDREKWTYDFRSDIFKFGEMPERFH